MIKKPEDIMSKKLQTVQSFDRLEDAFAKMKKNGIRHLPVIDATGTAIGIISDRDIQRAMNTYDSGAVDFNPDETVSDYMSSPVQSLPFDSDIVSVAQKMIENQISAVLISQNNCLVGIITHEDLLKFLVELLKPAELTMAENFRNWINRTPAGDIAIKLAGIGI